MRPGRLADKNDVERGNEEKDKKEKAVICPVSTT
jgi:hypothetical protein